MRTLFLHRAEAPPEWTELVLCKDIYHCLPSQLDKEDWQTVQLHIELLSVQERINSMTALRR